VALALVCVCVQAVTSQLQRFTAAAAAATTAAAFTGTFVGCQMKERQENVEPICQVCPVLFTTGA